MCFLESEGKNKEAFVKIQSLIFFFLTLAFILFYFILLAFAPVIELLMPENTFLISNKIASYMTGKIMLIKNN